MYIWYLQIDVYTPVNKSVNIRVNIRRISMENILLVVDMQNDFVTGSLGTKEAEAIVDNVKAKIENHKGIVIYTRDTHHENYLSTQEGRNLPVPHCIKGSEGWNLVEEINKEAIKRDSKIFDKPTFGSVEMAAYVKDMFAEGKVKSVEIIGLCTDICVISNALLLKAEMPELSIIVDSSCCAGVTAQSHENALNAMKMCQVEII